MIQLPEKSVEKIIANFLLNDMRGMLNRRKLELTDCGISPEAIGFMARMVHLGLVDKRVMRRLIEQWIDEHH